jgi:hypothetical protein
VARDDCIGGDSNDQRFMRDGLHRLQNRMPVSRSLRMPRFARCAMRFWKQVAQLQADSSDDISSATASETLDKHRAI